MSGAGIPVSLGVYLWSADLSDQHRHGACRCCQQPIFRVLVPADPTAAGSTTGTHRPAQVGATTRRRRSSGRPTTMTSGTSKSHSSQPPRRPDAFLELEGSVPTVSPGQLWFSGYRGIRGH
jgi:hypothetical protein